MEGLEDLEEGGRGRGGGGWKAQASQLQNQD